MKKHGRNELCWCGSGKKFKRCHLNRNLESPVAVSDWVKRKKDKFSQKKCMVPQGMQEDCAGKIIKAHSISKSANLKSLAKDGHVYGYSAELSDLIESKGKLRVKPIGVTQASTFLGFCSHHDAKLFSCIENEEFSLRKDQILALAFRSLCREYYGKQAVDFVPDAIAEMDRGRPDVEQWAFQAVSQLNRQGVEASRSDFKSSYEYLGKALQAQRSDALECLVLEYSSDLPFALSAAWTPLTDAKGKVIQDGLDYSAPLDVIVLFSARNGSSYYLCIAWPKDGNLIGREVAKSICENRPEVITSVYLQFAFRGSENIFFAKDWHLNLSSVARKHLDGLVHDGIDPFCGTPEVHVDPNIILHKATPVRVFQI